MMFAVAALAMVLSACGPQAPDTTLVISTDPVLGERVAGLLPVLAEKAGMELVRPVRVERRSREELERYLRSKLDQELPPELARHMSLSYAHLGLMDREVDLRGLLLSVYSEQVAGFYDPDSAALFVMDDMPEDQLEPLLVHELVHAVQDQTANLDSLTARERGNDRQVAAQAAIEGHATLIMLEHTVEKIQGRPVDLSQLPDFSQALGPALQEFRAQYPALASAPTIVQESLLFPYLKGASFVLALWGAGPGRPAPFGEHLPQSTEQILDPARILGVDPDWPTELEIDPGDGLHVLYENSLGQMETEILLQEHLGVPGRALARGWDGDRYLLLRGPRGEEGLFWVSVWDSAEERDRFVEGLRPALSGLPGRATLREADVLGRPGAILQSGDLPDLSLEIREGPAR